MKNSVKTLLHLTILGLLALTSNASAECVLHKWFSVDGSFAEGKFDRHYYVPAVSSLLYNETPYITTELRPIYAYHAIPNDSPVQGGYAHVVAAQIRLALTDRLGLIATKDGYTDLHFSQVFPDTDGFNNLTLGLKYALVEQPQNNFLLSIGARYEAPSGNIPTAGIDLAGADGDGLVDVFATAVKRVEKWNFQGSIGTNIALDSNKNSTELHYSLHVDYELLPSFFPLVEFNGLTTLSNGNVIALNLEGGDLMNIGTTDSGTLTTLAIGARYRFNNNLIVGVAWEPAVLGREDLHKSRVYADLVWHF